MRIAIAENREEISPVFDDSRRLVVVTIEDGHAEKCTEESVSEMSPQRRAARLKDLGVDVLLCGAVSRELDQALSDVGIQVRSFLMGRIETVLEAYLSGELNDAAFLMPGVRRHRQNGRTSREAVFEGNL